MKYLLSCSCGKSVAIEISQAGHRVQCDCGQTLDVPAMRLIRQLPTAPEAAATRKPLRARSWPLTRRLLFAAGLAVMVAGLGTAAFFQFVRSGLDTQERPWDNIAKAHRDIDQMNIEKTWELWTLVRTESIGPYRPPQFIIERMFSATWRKFVVVGVAAAVVGLVTVLIALLVGPQAKSRGKTTKHAIPKHN